ncbi:vesicle transport protein GOT1 [Iris pallida]|uniref:Vesicle transport protein GOT1 n=1 Tax=Iris pallida TaxID=29817 RepID=A0AAX6HKB0_IRIPA|nr:vesicle transport protein GOT1 [Iris pallida]
MAFDSLTWKRELTLHQLYCHVILVIILRLLINSNTLLEHCCLMNMVKKGEKLLRG